MSIKKIALIVLCLSTSLKVFSQSITLDPSSSSNAILDAKSNSKGLLVPRLTTAQRNAIQNPENGLLVYDTNINTMYYFNGYSWVKMENPDDAKTISSDTLDFDGSIAVSGSFLVVGLPSFSNRKGKCNIFRKTNGIWQFHSSIIANDGLNNDRFGTSVAIEGNRLVVGATGVSTSKGAIYIFELPPLGNIWTQRNKLTASDGVNGDSFGQKVALSDSRIAVGVPYADDGVKFDVGKVYVFTRVVFLNTPIWNQTLLATGTKNQDNLGTSVAIFNNEVLFGVPGDDLEELFGVNDSDNGSVSLWGLNNGNWTQTQKFYSIGTYQLLKIGRNIAFNDKYIAIGSEGQYPASNFSIPVWGSVYLKMRVQNIEKLIIDTSESGISSPETFTGFSSSLAILNDNLIIGKNQLYRGSNACIIKLNELSNTASLASPTKYFLKTPLAYSTYGTNVCLTTDEVFIPSDTPLDGKSKLHIESID